MKHKLQHLIFRSKMGHYRVFSKFEYGALFTACFFFPSEIVFEALYEWSDGTYVSLNKTMLFKYLFCFN